MAGSCPFSHGVDYTTKRPIRLLVAGFGMVLTTDWYMCILSLYLIHNLITMITAQTIKGMTDLRVDPVKVARLAKTHGPVYILNRSTPTSVLLDVTDYEELVDRLQDAEDALEITKTKLTAQKADFISHKQLLKKLDF